MTSLVLGQFAVGLSVGIGLWFVVYLSNRAWLHFWGFLK